MPTCVGLEMKKAQAYMALRNKTATLLVG